MLQLLPQEINEDTFETRWIDSTGLMFAELKIQIVIPKTQYN